MTDEMYNPVISSENNHGHISLPLFILDNFNRKGHISIRSMLQFLVWPAYNIFKHPAFITNVVDHEKNTPFLTGLEFHFHKDLYDTAAKWLHQGGYYKATIHKHLSQTSRTSYMPEYEVYADKQLLISGVYHFVCIDRSSHVKQIVPESLKQKLSQSDAEKPKYPERPLNARCHQSVIRPSDADNNSHTEYAKYFQLMHDAASTLSVKEKAFEYFEGDLANYWLKSVKMRFAGQSHVGDVLHCYVWQDARNPLLLHAQHVKKDRVICYGSMLFYPGFQSAKL